MTAASRLAVIDPAALELPPTQQIEIMTWAEEQ